AGGLELGPSWHCRPVTLKVTILPSAAISIPLPAERAQNPPAPFGPMGWPNVLLTSYVPLPMWSPVALPWMVQVTLPAETVHCPAPVPITCQSSTLSAAVAAGVTAMVSSAPSTTTKANNDFTERNVIDFSPLLGPSGPLPFAEQNFSDQQSEGIGRFNGIHPSIENRTPSFDSGLWA